MHLSLGLIKHAASSGILDGKVISFTSYVRQSSVLHSRSKSDTFMANPLGTAG